MRADANPHIIRPTVRWHGTHGLNATSVQDSQHDEDSKLTALKGNRGDANNEGHNVDCVDGLLSIGLVRRLLSDNTPSSRLFFLLQTFTYCYIIY